MAAWIYFVAPLYMSVPASVAREEITNLFSPYYCRTEHGYLAQINSHRICTNTPTAHLDRPAGDTPATEGGNSLHKPRRLPRFGTVVRNPSEAGR